MSVYYNAYEDFIAGKNVIVPFYGDVAGTQTAPVGPGGAPSSIIIVALAQEIILFLQLYQYLS